MVELGELAHSLKQTFKPALIIAILHELQSSIEAARILTCVSSHVHT
jgi:hypothetical protein